MGDRVLEPAAGGRPRGLPLHRVDPRPPAGGRPALMRLADEARGGLCRLVSVRASAARPVELGGWDLVRFWFNPPLSRLEEEIEADADFALFLALASPRLELRSFEAEPVGGGAHRLRAIVRELRLAPDQPDAEGPRPEGGQAGRGRAELPDGARVVTGMSARRSASSRAASRCRSVNWWRADFSTTDRAKVEWVVEAPAGSRVASSRGTSARGRRGTSSFSEPRVAQTAPPRHSCRRPSTRTRHGGVSHL